MVSMMIEREREREKRRGRDVYGMGVGMSSKKVVGMSTGSRSFCVADPKLQGS